MGKNFDYVVGNGLVESYSSGSNVEHLSAYYELLSQSKDLRVENNVFKIALCKTHDLISQSKSLHSSQRVSKTSV